MIPQKQLLSTTIDGVGSAVAVPLLPTEGEKKKRHHR